MPNLLQIPSEFYVDAAKAIAEYRKDTTPSNISEIERVLRSYVKLGQTKQIPDWKYSLPEADKDSLVVKVLQATRDMYLIQPNYGRTLTNFEVMETQAGRGLVSPNIAAPRAAQERYDYNLQTAPKIDPVQRGIDSFWGVVKDVIGGFLRAIGINIPVEAVVAIIAVVMLMFFTGAFRSA